MVEELQKKLQAELDNFKGTQKEYHKMVNQRQTLDGQLNENKAVKTELDLLKDDAEVFKLIGPVLVKMSLVDSKQNVTKRMEYIGKELKRADDMITQLDKKQDQHRETLQKLQQQFQQAQLKAAMKA